MMPTGWCPGRRAGESEAAATRRQIAEYPGSQVVRKFFPQQLGGWVDALSQLQPGMTAVVSYHGFGAPVEAFAAAIPPGVTVRLSPWHEPEKKITPAQLLDEFRHLNAVIPRDHPLRAEGVLQFGPTMTVYRARIGAPADLRRFVTPELVALSDFVAWDWYPSNPAERTPTSPAAYEPPESAFRLMVGFAAETGLPWAISEVNHEDIPGTTAASWYRSAHAYAKAHGCRWWAHFHRGGGDLTSPTTPRPETAAALRELIEQEATVAWYLNHALTRFRDAVNAAYPGRDKTSDGTVGDLAHQATSSDHNPDPDGSVDAWDMDVDLRSGDDPAAIEHLKDVFEAHPSSRYWIHNRQIASRSDGWVRRPYDGPNPHDHHVHWNTREGYEASDAPWQLGDDMTPAQFLALLKDPAVAATLRAMPWQYPVTANSSALNVLFGQALPQLAAGLKALGEAVARESANPEEIRALLAELPQPAPVDVDQLASALAPKLAVALPADSPITDSQLERVLRTVLGSVDNLAS